MSDQQTVLLECLTAESDRWQRAKARAYAHLQQAMTANDNKATLEWLVRFDLVSRTLALAEQSRITLTKRIEGEVE
jgi:hypothetical protein